MTVRLLDVVVLMKDLPSHGLKVGDVGTIVEVYQPDGLEVGAAGRSFVPSPSAP